jgi:phosphinothricin acetyltransferase
MRVREATPADAAACAALYAPYVRETTISFEIDPPSADEMATRIAASHVWLVAEDEDRVIGFAYAGEFKSRPAYARTCEVTVYLDRDCVGRGAGRALYAELLPRLAAAGFRVAIAIIALPNEASEGLHRAFGFEPAGVLRGVGFKQGAWHDVAYAQLTLGGPQTTTERAPGRSV